MPEFFGEASSSQMGPCCQDCSATDFRSCLGVSIQALPTASFRADILRLGRRESIRTSSWTSGQPQLLTVIDGAIKIYAALPNGRRQTTYFGFAGERLMLAGNTGPVPTIIKALASAVLCRIDTSRLDEARKAHREIDRALWSFSSSQVGAASSKMLRLGCMTATARVASFITEMAGRIGDGTAGELAVHLPMGRQDIAEYLGLKAETVSRVFSTLRRSGVVTLPKPNTIIVKDPAKLAQIAV